MNQKQSFRLAKPKTNTLESAAQLSEYKIGESPRGSTDSISQTLPDNDFEGLNKIIHFVEVGFLIDRNDFRLVNTFDEATYDSSLKKYLFEF